MPIAVTVSGKHITLDLLLWRHGKARGATSERVTEALELNRGLADLGPFMPLGTVVLIPDLPPVAEQRREAAPVVSLFD